MVFFVGAGPGAPDLITVRGQKLLQQADVIIYAGSLVNPALLDVRKENCEVYNSAYMNLDEVLQVTTEAHKAGKTVVRLHTGDPSLFGAIQEQMDALDAKQIPYEICPGVSSMSGAAAAIGREYTLPDVAQSVIICRMEGRTAVPDGQQLQELASHHTTMIIFLSAGLTEQVQQALLQGGYMPDTPACIVYKATWPEQSIHYCTVATLHETATENHISKTALLLIGDFLGKEYELSRLYAPDFSTEFRKAKE